MMSCIGTHTPVLMWDGHLKEAQDLVMGDKVVGDDGKERNVLDVVHGENLMYEIIANNGNRYSVGSSHVMTLKYYRHKHIYWNDEDATWRGSFYDPLRRQGRTLFLRGKPTDHKIMRQYMDNLPFADDGVFDVGLQYYLPMKRSTQNRMHLLLNHCCMEWDGSPTLCHPYEAGSRFQVEEQYTHNDKRVRLDFLAGVIDWHGTINNYNGSRPIVVITLPNHCETMATMFCRMCHSLGFIPTLIHHTIFLTGNNLWNIPLHKQKKIPYYSDDKELESYSSTFRVRSKGEGKYCGLQLDGNGRFLLGNFMIVHS